MFCFVVTHNWKNLKDAVQMHIKSLNWNYKTQLRSKNVKYINGLGQLIDSHTIKVQYYVCYMYYIGGIVCG